MFMRLQRELMVALPFAVSATLVVCALVLSIAFNPTHSMPYGFYLRIPYMGGAIEVDDLVQIRNPEPGLLGVTEEHLLKTVTEIMEDGRLVVSGISPDSFDSRFFGPVDISLVEAVCFPIVTSTNPEMFSGLYRLAEIVAGWE